MVHPKASEELVGMLKDYESVFSTKLCLNGTLHLSFVGLVVCLLP